MRKKLSKPKAAEPPVALGLGKGAAAPPPASTSQSSLAPRYKVVELSTVDEISLESTLNTWIVQGWRLDGIHFAMRESSKRPAMAFVLFTQPAEKVSPAARDSPADHPILRPLPDGQYASSDPWRRLRQLAGAETADDDAGDPTSE